MTSPRSRTTRCGPAATSRRRASRTSRSPASTGRSRSRRSRASAARRSWRATTTSSGSRACAPTTTGWSRSGAATPTATSSRCASSRCGTSTSPPPRSTRNAARGARAVCFSEIPTHLGLPSIHTGYWDPLFAVVRGDAHGAVHAHRLVVEDAGRVARRAAVGRIMLSFNNSMASLADCLFSGVLVRFPELKLAYSEGQIGWIPYALERADNVWEFHSNWTKAKETIPEPPSTYYHGRIFGCFTNDVARAGVARRGRRGQRLLRDRLPAHRHDVAVREGGGRAHDRRAHRRAALQGPPRQRDPHARPRPRLNGRERDGCASPAVRRGRTPTSPRP